MISKDGGLIRNAISFWQSLNQMSAFFQNHQGLFKKIAKISHSIIDFLFYIFISLALFIFALTVWRYENCGKDIMTIIHEGYINVSLDCIITYAQ